MKRNLFSAAIVLLLSGWIVYGFLLGIASCQANEEYNALALAGNRIGAGNSKYSVGVHIPVTFQYDVLVKYLSFSFFCRFDSYQRSKGIGIKLRRSKEQKIRTRPRRGDRKREGV